ncbi:MULTISPECIES: DMT family transporter [Gammaproteobacteria]|uniref:DMT family transporter n=1 Tax=Gammaproteobacteria TaxID=1236 RepID=UPI000DD08714|nr:MULTISPECIES: DMT family transporter [Gammaproteobacteria]RTE86658.1 DMT family transporter [Aliidiomarina sp. B3213]TCZ90789.1 DMT family transporter [Lysobacter sp. N42]
MHEHYPLTTWLKLFFLALVWGSSFFLIKKGLVTFPPLEVAAIRLASAALALAPFAIVRLKRVKKKQWPVILSVGLTGSMIPAFLFALAQTNVDSGVTGSLNALTPLFVLIIGAVIFHQKITATTGIGLAIGFVGTLILILMNATGSFNLNAHALFVVIATICYGINTNLIKEYLPDQSPLTITGVSLLMVLPIATLYLLGPAEVVSRLDSATAWWSLVSLIVLGVVGTALALILFNHLVQIASTVFASSVTYLIPVVAVFLGLLDGEVIGIWQVSGMALILGGVWLANKKPRTPPPQ